jgi:hypothetical protein
MREYEWQEEDDASVSKIYYNQKKKHISNHFLTL